MVGLILNNKYQNGIISRETNYFWKLYEFTNKNIKICEILFRDMFFNILDVMQLKPQNIYKKWDV